MSSRKRKRDVTGEGEEVERENQHKARRVDPTSMLPSAQVAIENSRSDVIQDTLTSDGTTSLTPFRFLSSLASSLSLPHVIFLIWSSRCEER